MFLPVNITVNVGGHGRTVYDRGIDLLAGRLDRFAAAASGFREPLRLIGESLQARIAGEFRTESTTAYGRWTALSEPYGSWKAARAPGAGILVGIRPVHKGTRQHPNRHQTYATSGQMRRELLDPASVMVDSRRMLYAPVSDIAGFHQTGTDRMPARPLVALLPGALHEWDRILVEHLARQQQEAGL